MKISFPINKFVYFNNTKTNNIQNPFLKPNPVDSFERTSFRGEEVHETPENYDFEVRSIKNMRCPVCGLIMLTDEQVEQFVKDVANKKGIDLVTAFEKYEDDSIFTGVKQDPPKSIYRPQKEKIVNILKKLAIQNPNLSLQELVRYEANRRIDELVLEQQRVVDNVARYIQRCNATREKKQVAATIIEEYQKRILGQGEAPFARRQFIYALSNIANDPTTQRKIIELAEQLPSSQDDINSWFVNYSKNESSSSIARKFVQQSIPTAEHLQPRSKDGGSSIKNFICDCADCNSRRGDMEFDIWSTTIPNFREKLQKYLQDVQDAYDLGVLSQQYRSYPEKVIETIKKLSNGAIILHEPESIDSTKKARIIEKRQAKLEEIRKEIEKKEKEKQEKIKHISKLKTDGYYSQLSSIETQKQKIKAIEEQIASLQDKDEILQLEARKASLEQQLVYQQRIIEGQLGWQQERIAHLQKVIEQMKLISAKLDALKTQAAKKGEFDRRKQEISKENDLMISENNEILKKPRFNPEDDSKYQEYLYQSELLETADGMLKKLNTQGGRRLKEKEVILAGIEGIKAKMAAMRKSDRVIYFINMDKINSNISLMEAIDATLEEINGKKGYIKEYQQQLDTIGNKQSLQQLQRELEGLVEARERQQQIENLASLEQEVIDLGEILAHNREVYAEVKKNYKTMTSEEFEQQINLIY